MAENWVKKVILNSKVCVVDVMKVVNETGMGIALLTDDQGHLAGLVTDGDIRRALLAGSGLQSPIAPLMKRDPVFLRVGFSDNQALRLFSNIIRHIPVLDEQNRVVDILLYSKFCDSLAPRQSVTVRAKAPMRVSFAGGGTDVSPYIGSSGGVVLSATINRYCHGTLKKRSDSRIVLRSLDYNCEASYDNLSSVKYDGVLDLVKAVIRLMNPLFGFELELVSDSLPGSGLGGSAAVASVTAGLLNYFREDRLDDYQLADIAYQAERVELKVAGGWQDQYACVFGGFNYIEFKTEGVVVHPLRINEDVLNELEASLVFCNTRITRDSHTIHKAQFESIKQNSSQVKEALDQTREFAVEMKNLLLRGDLVSFGKMLHQAWLVKKQFESTISNNTIEEIYDLGLKCGALGGKVLGAGGGGYIVFFCPPSRKNNFVSALRQMNVEVENVIFDFRGLRSWKGNVLIE